MTLMMRTVIGNLTHLFLPCKKKISGKWQWRFGCLQDGCTTTYSETVTTTSINRHYACEHSKFKTKPTQMTLLDMPLGAKVQDKIALASLKWIIKDMLPFSTVDSEAFKDVIRSINHHVKVPCGATLRNRLPTYASYLRAELKQLLEKTLKHGCLTLDGWTSAANKPFLGITLHWLDEHFTPRQFVLAMAPQPYPHDAIHMARLIRK